MQLSKLLENRIIVPLESTDREELFEELIDLTSGLAEEAQEIGGVDLDELLSRQAAISQSQEEFTGYLPEEDPGYNTF